MLRHHQYFLKSVILVYFSNPENHQQQMKEDTLCTTIEVRKNMLILAHLG